MARNFIVPVSEGKTLNFDMGGMAALPNSGVTIAVVVVPPTQKSPGFWTGILFQPSTSFGLFYNQPGLLHWTGGNESDAAMTVNQSDGWCMLAVTNSTAAVTFHKYVIATNTWTHETLGGLGAQAAPGAGTTWRLGEGDMNLATPSYWAAGAVWHRQMVRAEIERLPRGGWWLSTPDLHVEFKSGRDNPAYTKDFGRYGLKMTTDSGTFRAAIGDPPGFRFSPLNRRR